MQKSCATQKVWKTYTPFQNSHHCELTMRIFFRHFVCLDLLLVLVALLGPAYSMYDHQHYMLTGWRQKHRLLAFSVHHQKKKDVVVTSLISDKTSNPSPTTTTHSITDLLTLRGGGDPTSTSLAVPPSKTICWVVLFSAILLDTVCATLMKVAREENSIPKLLLSYFGYFLSLSGFGFSLASIDVSIAYAVWAALGTAVVSAAGIIVFNERCDAAKLCCLAMVIFGVIGLNLTEEH